MMSPSANAAPLHDKEIDTPFDIIEPVVQTAPVVFASPHSGHDYPAAFVTASQLDPVSLRRSEDAFVDELYEQAPHYGAPLLRAHFPRAYVDPNREPWELDPDMFQDHLPDWVNTTSPRVRAGLGTIAKVVTDGAEIYGEKLSFAQAQSRIAHCYTPYHEALTGLLDRTMECYGTHLLIDCHSMPSIGGPMDRDPGTDRVDMVLGDANGTSCAPKVINLAHQVLRDMGYKVVLNTPYAGGFTTRHYGKPLNNRHALQIEVNRALYMDEQSITRSNGFAKLAGNLTTLIDALTGIDPEELKR